MLADQPSFFLLASADPLFLAAIEPALTAAGAHVEVVMRAEAALAAMTAPHPPTLALLDHQLPALEPGMEPAAGLEALLAAVRSEASGRRFPIVLAADEVDQRWIDRMAEGILDDLVPRSTAPAFLRLRLETVQRAFRRSRELEMLREAAQLNAQTDHLTGVYNREAMLSMLCRETDRLQRSRGQLCMVLFDIDDFGHWNERLGADACDELLCQIVARVSRQLRSYDLLGRVGKDEFLVALPGCSCVNAVLLAERLRSQAFGQPYELAGRSIRLTACFGVVSSLGRTPVVVLREAEEQLAQARADGPESIASASDCPRPTASFAALPGDPDERFSW